MMVKPKRIKLLIATVPMLLLSMLLSTPVLANPGYDSYNYNYWGEIVQEPAAYVPYKVLKGNDVSQNVGEFKDPADMCVGKDKICVADSGNNRIVVLNNDLSLDFIITEFNVPVPADVDVSQFITTGKAVNTEDGGNEEADGEEAAESKTATTVSNPYSPNFNNPQGVYIDSTGHIYVADTDNSRVLEFNESGEFVRMISKPETNLLSSTFAYKPMKLAVDGSGHIYISAYGVNLGIIELDQNGKFRTFIGAIQVNVSLTDYIWRNFFTTKEQKDRMIVNIPTEYSNIFLDKKQFIYGTISTLSDDEIKAGATVIRRLNPTGVDVLRRLGNFPVSGDIGATAETSKFDDVTATSFGVYFVLDSAQGKVFMYDYDGNLMTAFGQKGNRWGNSQSPVALCSQDDGQRLLMLDKSNGSVIVYDSTDYGSSLLTALEEASVGKHEEAYKAWEHVLKLDSNNEYGYIGVGRYYLKNGDYKTAMKYFKSVNNRTYYNEAFKYYRKELMQNKFGVFITIGIVIVILIVIAFWIRKLICKVRDFKCQ